MGRGQHRPDRPERRGPSHPRSLRPRPRSTLGRKAGVFKSTDSGGTWAAANTGLNGWRSSALAIDPATSATLYAGTFTGGVFKSTDSGGTWSPANTGLPGREVSALAIDPATPATLYVGMDFRGVFKSTYAGGSWVAANTGLPDFGAGFSGSVLAINPAIPATLYAGIPAPGSSSPPTRAAPWAAANTGTEPHRPARFRPRPGHQPRDPLDALRRDGWRTCFKSTDSGGTWVGR